MPAHTPVKASIEIDGVAAGYRKDHPIIEGLSLTLKTPGLYRVGGSNGSGKSTLLELLSGFLQPWAGTVRLCGTEANSPDARHLRSVCRTTPALYPSMTVRDHLALAARTRRIDPDTSVARVERYGLDGWTEQPVSSLSTGNVRKLWLLMCTVADTPIVAMDEPFNGMDAQGIEALIEEANDWASSKVVVLVSHTVPPQLAIDHSFIFERSGMPAAPSTVL